MALGNMVVKVSTAGRLIPVEGAKVFVVRKNGGRNDTILALRTTGRSGIADSIEVETPARWTSTSPGNEEPFAKVDIRVEHPFYYTYYITDAQVFAETESVQNVELIPLAIPTENRTETVNITPQNL